MLIELGIRGEKSRWVWNWIELNLI